VSNPNHPNPQKTLLFNNLVLGPSARRF